VTLAGRVAVVSGAGAPLGHAISLALARAGAAVGLVGPGAAGGTIQKLASTGAPSMALPVALEDRDGTRAAFARVVTALGRLHVAVHSWVPPVALARSPITEVGEERWDQVWEATMKATIVFLQAAFAAFGGQQGRIIVVTPTAWARGVPGLGPYSAAVEGQRLLAKSAARQWGGQGITVNCVAPAWESVVDADARGEEQDGSMGPAPAPLGPVDLDADVGAAVVSLAGDGTRGITGATLCVDGGAAMAP